MAISADVKSQLFRQSSSNCGGEQLIRLPLECDDSSSSSNGSAAPASPAAGSNGKAWTREEHERFLEGLELFPSGPWKEVAAFVGTRTTRQTMTHAQKYREKIARRKRGLRGAAAAGAQRAAVSATSSSSSSCVAMAVSVATPLESFTQQLKLAQASPTSVGMLKSELFALGDPLDFNGCFLELELDVEPAAASPPHLADLALDHTLLMALASADCEPQAPQLSLSDEEMDLIMDSVVTSTRAPGLATAFSFVC